MQLPEAAVQKAAIRDYYYADSGVLLRFEVQRKRSECDEGVEG
jgi:hypothetical protein